MSTSCIQRQLVRLQIYSEHLAEDSDNKYFVTEESRLWSNKVISYFFDAAPDNHDKDKESFVIAAMREYAKYANVKFVLSAGRSSANIRITFSPAENHWVAIGTDALIIDTTKATMNLAWIDPTLTPTANSAIALHAIGHVLGLVHEKPNSHMSNFREYDEGSIMRYSDNATTAWREVDEVRLSDRDKAWLSLNYPKAPGSQGGGRESIGSLEHSLTVLDIDDGSASKIRKTGDISERRFLYSQFVASRGLDKATDQNTVGELIQGLRDYPDPLLKLKAQLGPKAVPGRNLPGAPPRLADIRQIILDFLRILRTSGGSPPGSDRFNEIILALLELMEMTGSVDPSDEPLGGLVTLEELDDLQARLTAMLNHDTKEGVSMDVQRGLLAELPGIQNILEWFSRTASENSTHVHTVPRDAAENMLGMLAKSPARNTFQEVYHLCFASYFVHDINGTEKELQKKHQELLEFLLPDISRHATTGGIEGTQRGKWELVWGPVIWKVKANDDSGGPDLAWYIAYNGSVVCGDDEEPRPTYVVAIAGTQTRSVHTWLNSNFDVTTAVDFKNWVSDLRSNPDRLTLPQSKIEWESAYIAKGTARTVWQLLTVQPPSGAKAERQSLLAFLRSESQSNPDMRIITTGHSLGGALCPTLAAVLVELDVVLRDRILTYPIAGPSPGNDAFAKYFSETLPPIPANRDELESCKYQVWNFNIVNAYDPVPQAWSSDKQAAPKQNLQNIGSMIPGSYIKSVFTAIIKNIIEDLSSASLRYMPLQSQIFYPRPSEEFKDVRPQHTGAYHVYVGITPPNLVDALE